MPDILYLDFETRAIRDLKKVGAFKYTLCPEFHVLCVAFALNNESVISAEGVTFCDAFDARTWDKWETIKGFALRKDVIFEAHYAGFEFWVYHNYLVKKYDFPSIPIERWRCSAAAAASKGLPRDLSGLGRAIDSSIKKDEGGKKIMLKMCKPLPEAQQKKRDGKWAETDEEFKLLMAYCEDDVRAERACGKITGQLSESEHEVWIQDQLINQRGVFMDIDLAESGVQMADELKQKWMRSAVLGLIHL